MSLERIEITPFAVIAGEILQNRRTGYLTILQAAAAEVLYWSQGELVMAASAAPEDSLGDFLVRRGAIPADRAAQLFARRSERRRRARARVRAARPFRAPDAAARMADRAVLPLFALDEGTAAFTEDEAAAAGETRSSCSRRRRC